MTLIWSSFFPGTEMTKRVTMLVVTDGLCWLPICIFFFISQYRELPDTVYFVTACVLLPINSAINPMIYSQFGIHLVGYFRKWKEQQNINEKEKA